MMMTQLALTELLCAKFCHDVIGPVGAINNGLEFLEENDESMQGKALELITASAFEASARLQFFRQTYGVVADEGEADISRLCQITENFFKPGKITLDWPRQHMEAAGIPLSHKLGRLLLNLVFIASSGLIHGGTVAVRLETLPQGKTVTVRGTGRNIRVDQVIQGILTDAHNTHPLDKRNVQVHFTRLLADELGISLDCLAGPDCIEFNAREMAYKTHNTGYLNITTVG